MRRASRTCACLVLVGCGTHADESRGSNPPETIGCVGTGGPSVVVTVRDRHGRPAATGASLVIEDGAFRDSVGPTAAWDGLMLGAGERRPGRYTLRVTKPGYHPVTLTGVVARPTGDPRCHYAEDTGRASVTLDLLPGAPVVRSVVVLPDAMGLDGIPGTEHDMAAIVDASPGHSRAVRWSSSDPTLLVVRPTSDSTAVVVPQCRSTGGRVTVTATSVADPRMRGRGTVGVGPPNDDPRLGPTAINDLARACLARLRARR